MRAMNLFESIGEETIRKVIRTFYERAIIDPMIGYFFFGKDHEHLVQQQIAFATGMLGGPASYRGRPILPLHQPLLIRHAHFNRRRVMMREAMLEFGVSEAHADAWLALEEQLLPMILGSPYQR